MNQNRIRLTESQLHRVIKESVNKVLNEVYADRSKEGIAKAIKARNKRTVAPLDIKYRKANDPEMRSLYDTEYRNQVAKTKNQVKNITDMYNEANPENLNTYTFIPRYGENSDFQMPYSYKGKNIPKWPYKHKGL